MNGIKLLCPEPIARVIFCFLLVVNIFIFWKIVLPNYKVSFGEKNKDDNGFETGKEIREAVKKLDAEYDSITLIAGSIGAFFSMNAGIDVMIRCAYFISPVVDMEQLILDMMSLAGVTEVELKEKGMIPTSFGEDLSWEYLCYVREHPVCWTVPTRILYGSRDNLTSYETALAFAESHNAELTVMEEGEHWFHTDEQMRFLDNWITKGRSIL